MDGYGVGGFWLAKFEEEVYSQFSGLVCMCVHLGSQVDYWMNGLRNL